MDPCVTCGTTEETTSVCTCDCQCLETARQSGCREIKLLAPTRDTATAWAENDPIVPEGVLCLVKDRLFDGSLEYFIGDGESKYSELPMLYAGAPLSRTGAENHSPIAASGKSTLDPSWLPAATSSTLGAVMTSTTGAAGTVPITASNKSTLDSSWFPDATSSTKGAVMASTTTAADNVVKADANGSLAGWGDAIASAIIDSEGRGGLVVNPETNLVEVDFDQMPTDKFETMLKSLKMLIPLTSNMNFYVNTGSPAAADTIEDGRGTQAKPFKTIQACVNYVTNTYSIGNYHITIRVVAGTYNENVVLPNFSRGTGYIEIIPDSGSRDVIVSAVTNSAGTRGTCFSAQGGFWVLRYMDARRVENPTSANGTACACYAVSGQTTLDLYGCAARQSMPTTPSPLGGEDYEVRLFSIDAGGTMRINHGTMAHLVEAEKPSSGAPSVQIFNVARDGALWLSREPDTNGETTADFSCSGSCDNFLNMRQVGSLYNRGTGNRINFTGTMTGKRYRLVSGSHASTGTNSDTYFPGDSEGSADSSTYCWYE